MNNNNIEQPNANFDDLVRKLLKLDPDALASMDPKTRSTAAGLNLFMRMTVARAIGSIWAPEDFAFRLYTDESAKAASWPDARTLNLSTVFACALASATRRGRGLRDIPLHNVDPNHSEAPEARDTATLWTTSQVAAVATTLFKKDMLAARDLIGRLPDSRSASYRSIVRELLELTPAALVRPWYEKRSDANAAFARDPDGATLFGMAAALMAIIDTYEAAVEKNIDHISLMVVDEPRRERKADAMRVNISSLLAGALLSDGKRQIDFFVCNIAGKPARVLH